MKNNLLGFFKLNPTSLLGLILGLVIGVLLLVSPGTVTNLLFTIVAWALIIFGAINVLSSFFGGGKRTNTSLGTSLLMVLGGILLLVFKGSIIDAIELVIGILLIAGGAIKLFSALDMRKVLHGQWLITIVIAIAMIVFGLLLTFGVFNVTDTILRIVGIVFIIESAQDLFAYIRSK